MGATRIPRHLLARWGLGQETDNDTRNAAARDRAFRDSDGEWEETVSQCGKYLAMKGT